MKKKCWRQLEKNKYESFKRVRNGNYTELISNSRYRPFQHYDVLITLIQHNITDKIHNLDFVVKGNSFSSCEIDTAPNVHYVTTDMQSTSLSS